MVCVGEFITGLSWVKPEAVGQFYWGVTISADGKRIAAVGSGQVKVSFDTGRTWSKQVRFPNERPSPLYMAANKF